MTVMRYEVIPLAGIEERVEAVVPRETKITVTVSPTRGLDPTLALVESLAGAGYDVVPHLAARSIRSDEHLGEVLDRLTAVGTRDIFVIGGDAHQPAGPHRDALSLLRAIHEHGRTFPEIGIAGYPQGHPAIDSAALATAVREKVPLVTYVSTQMCFDGRDTAAWINATRAAGIDLPIWIGIPGVVKPAKLLRISTRIGLGESTRFLRKNAGRVARILRPGAYRPDKLIRSLEPTIVDPAAGVAGFHVFTFNEVEATEAWRNAR